MSDQIPPEIVTKILLHCEIPTILRCRCVSKQWLAIIDDSHFIKHHMDYSSIRLFFNDLCGDLSGTTNSDTLEVTKVPIFSPIKPVYLVGSCNGLLCYRNKTQSFCIMNPSTLKHIYFPGFFPSNLGRDDKAGLVSVGYGFGYDCVNDDYKVVRIQHNFDSKCVDDYGYTCFLESEMVIRNVKTSMLKYVKMPYVRTVNGLGVLAGGALHWLMGKYNYSRSIIVGFDLGTDKFRELPEPDFLNNDDTCRGSIGLLGTWLCISGNNHHYTDEVIDFWVMKEYGVKESWTKLFSILTEMSCIQVAPLGFLKSDSLVLLELDERRLVLYDKEEKCIRNELHKGPAEAVVCLRSLAPLPSNI